MTRCTSTNALFLPYLTVDKQRLDLSSTPTSFYSFVLLRSRHQSLSLSTQHFNISAHINPSLPLIKVNSCPLLACSLITSCHQPHIIDDSYLSLPYSVLKLYLILPTSQQLLLSGIHLTLYAYPLTLLFICLIAHCLIRFIYISPGCLSLMLTIWISHLLLLRFHLYIVLN